MKEVKTGLVYRLKRDFIIPITIVFNLMLILSFIMIIVFGLRNTI